MNTLKSADELLEQNNFAGAIKAYIEHLRSNEPNFDSLCNLGVAEHQESIRFGKELSGLYPQNLDARVVLVNAYRHAGFFPQAIQTICNSLSVFDSPVQQLKLKRLRMGIAIDGQLFDSYAQDVCDVWTSPVRAAHHFRVGIFREIESISSPKAIDTLSQLKSREELPAELAQLISRKIYALELLKPILEMEGKRKREPGNEVSDDLEAGQ